MNSSNLAISKICYNIYEWFFFPKKNIKQTVGAFYNRKDLGIVYFMYLLIISYVNFEYFSNN